MRIVVVILFASVVAAGGAALNELKLKEYNDPEITTGIAQNEMAFRMQASVPELVDLSSEPRGCPRSSRDHLTFKFQGRHYRLTDVHGKVVRGVLG